MPFIEIQKERERKRKRENRENKGKLSCAAAAVAVPVRRKIDRVNFHFSIHAADLLGLKCCVNVNLS